MWPALAESRSAPGVGAIFPQRVDRVYAIVTVLAEHRRCGVGTALYKAISAWAAERGLNELEVAVLDNDRESLAFARRRGFVEERRDLGLVLDLAEVTAPEVELPEGVEIVTWAARPGARTRSIRGRAGGAAGHPGPRGRRHRTVRRLAGARRCRAPATVPRRPSSRSPASRSSGTRSSRSAEGQPTIAYHDLSAVRRAWRGRGIARALKATQINWALANGYTELRTSNEARNAPIRHLNAAFGYRPGIGRIYLVGPISDS